MIYSFSKTGTIIGITENAQPCTTVLEVVAETVAKHQLGTGSCSSKISPDTRSGRIGRAVVDRASISLADGGWGPY